MFWTTSSHTEPHCINCIYFKENLKSQHFLEISVHYHSLILSYTAPARYVRLFLVYTRKALWVTSFISDMESPSFQIKGATHGQPKSNRGPYTCYSL